MSQLTFTAILDMAAYFQRLNPGVDAAFIVIRAHHTALSELFLGRHVDTGITINGLTVVPDDLCPKGRACCMLAETTAKPAIDSA